MTRVTREIEVEAFLQIEPRWHRDWLRGAVLARATQTRPRRPVAGAMVVKVRLLIDERAFHPLQPSAEIHVPAEHTEPVVVTTEPVQTTEGD